MSQSGKPKATRAVRYLRAAMLLIALALPILSLAVLGSVWLWQNGYILHWAVAALATTAVAFGIERWLLRDAFEGVDKAAASEPIDVSYTTERENAAWQAVLKLSEETEPDTINSRDALIDLGKRTVETVARQMHPEHKDPLLKFTLPELLALIERVSAELGPFMRETIPLGDRLTVGQFLAIYRWRGILDVADKAYDIWRIVRMMNPATAVAQELREKFTRQLYDWGRKELARRLTTAYVREVGRGAIDLYSGRLRYRTQAPAALEEAGFGQHDASVESLLPPHAGETPVAEARKAPPARSTRLATAGRVLRQTGNAAKLLLRGKGTDKLR